MTTLDDVLAYIKRDATADELREISRFVSDGFSNLQRRARSAFRVGDRVTFESKRHGQMIVGTITKINVKTIAVDTDSGMHWKVSPSLLSPV